MTISFILNGEDVSLNAKSYERLADVLRTRFGLLGVKADCRRGVCGNASSSSTEGRPPPA